MSSRDRSILKSVGITVTRAANFLNLTRQSLHDGMKKTSHYLDENRLARIYFALVNSHDSNDAPKAAALLASVKDNKLNIDSYLEDQQSRIDYYCIFAKLPLELRQSTYLSQRMVKAVYPHARIVAYFVGDETTGEKLHKVISRKKGDEEWKADIYIIESTLSRYLPNTVLLRNKKGSWKGQIFSFDHPSEHTAQNNQLLVDAVDGMALKLILEEAGFRLDVEDTPNNFLSKDPVSVDGQSFKLLHVIKGNCV